MNVQPIVKVTLTAVSTDHVWTRLFTNFDLKAPPPRSYLLKALDYDRKLAQEEERRNDDYLCERSGYLTWLYIILKYSTNFACTCDIKIAGVLLGRLECVAAGRAFQVPNGKREVELAKLLADGRMKMACGSDVPCETCKNHYKGGCQYEPGYHRYDHATKEWIEMYRLRNVRSVFHIQPAEAVG